VPYTDPFWPSFGRVGTLQSADRAGQRLRNRPCQPKVERTQLSATCRRLKGHSFAEVSSVRYGRRLFERDDSASKALHNTRGCDRITRHALARTRSKLAPKGLHVSRSISWTWAIGAPLTRFSSHVRYVLDGSLFISILATTLIRFIRWQRPTAANDVEGNGANIFER